VERNYPLFLKKVEEDVGLKEVIKSRYPELLKGPHTCEEIDDRMKRGILMRMRNKLLLQSQYNLTIDPDKVLFAMIHRIVDQKGFQLLLDASEGIFKHLGFQGVIGGPVPSGDQKGEELARGLMHLKSFYPKSVAVNIGFLDVATALLSCDVFLMPSMYEPGGISQLEAFSCGCLVVARATGGLRDTVHPLRIKGRFIEGNGFLFTDYSPESFYDAMARCAAFFTKTHEGFIYRARHKAQDSVYYWDRSAREYIKEIYTFKEIIRII
jgi:starch synthase